MKLVLVDLDGIVADSSERFNRAEARREFYRQHLGDCLSEALARPTNHAFVQKSVDDLLETLYWQTAFEPALVAHDTIIDGARDALDALEIEGYTVFFLTSRPEHLRAVTSQWLVAHAVRRLWRGQLVMKPEAAQFQKTVIWKAITVHTLASFYGVSDLWVIDDEQKNLDEIAKYSGPYTLRYFTSLAEAVRGNG